MAAVSPPVFLFTDFGAEGPYLAQLEAAVLGEAPTARVMNLLSNAPTTNPRAAAYLLAALASVLPRPALLLGVVDPGVGTERQPLWLEADGLTLIGPDNGLLVRAAAVAPAVQAWRIDWRPERLSLSFHGRNLFAPVAGKILSGRPVARSRLDPAGLIGADWPEQLAEIVYLDHYGNAYTGLRGDRMAPATVLRCAGRDIRHASVFAAAPPATPFWYVNSCGLVEIAVNRDRADRLLGLAVGDGVEPVGGIDH